MKTAEAEQEVSIKGEVVVTFGSDYEGWRAGKIRLRNGDTVGFSGSCEVERGETVTLHGTWTDDPKYGRQFKVAWSLKHLPEDWAGIQQLFEVDGRFKDIGPVRSRAIVDAVRDMGKTLDEILSNFMLIEELRTRSGVPAKALDVLAEQWEVHREENEVRATLLGLGIPNRIVGRLWNTFGSSVVKQVKEDPWSLCDLVPSFSFKRADELGLKLGLERACAPRLTAGILAALERQTKNGHTWTARERLVGLTIQELNLGRPGDRAAIQARLAGLIDDKDHRLSVSTIEGIGEVVSLPWVLGVEKLIASEFLPGKSEPNKILDLLGPDWEADLLKGVDQNGVKKIPNEAQMDAIRKAMKHRKVVVTGPAGSGKTFVISLIVQLYLDCGLKVALGAPTGKAARRMHEVLVEAGVARRLLPGSEPTTLHRLLKCDGFGNWGHDTLNPLDTDLLLVDETSMLDIDLMRRVLNALPPNASLVLVGDPEQLPPVGPGAVLRDIIKGNRCEAARLEKVMRHAGVLKANAQEILRGVMRPTTEEKQPDGALTRPWIVDDSHAKSDSAVRAIVEHFKRAIQGKAPEELFEIQVISPQYEHGVGIRKLNKVLQRVAQRILYGNDVDSGKEEEEEEESSGEFFEGDKVIQTKNDHAIGLLNGDQGIVQTITSEGIRLIRPGAAPVFVPTRASEGLMLAYAISVHRAQGSQWNTVIAAIHSEHKMNSRKLVYTAATRATKQMIVVGDRPGIHGSISKPDTAHRRTFTAPVELMKVFAREINPNVRFA